MPIVSRKRRRRRFAQGTTASCSSSPSADEKSDLLVEIKDMKKRIKELEWKIEELETPLSWEDIILKDDMESQLETLISEVSEIKHEHRA